MRLVVRLTPKANADRIDGWTADSDGRPVLAARVRARPVEGEANAALERLVARALGLPASKVRVARGAAARLKVLEIEGVEAATVKAALDQALVSIAPPEPLAPPEG